MEIGKTFKLNPLAKRDQISELEKEEQTRLASGNDTETKLARLFQTHKKLRKEEWCNTSQYATKKLLKIITTIEYVLLY